MAEGVPYASDAVVVWRLIWTGPWRSCLASTQCVWFLVHPCEGFSKSVKAWLVLRETRTGVLSGWEAVVGLMQQLYFGILVFC